MDRALLERMIGAVVLVALIVLVAPALLDGTEPAGSARGGDSASASVRTEVIVLNSPVTDIRPGAGPADVAAARAANGSGTTRPAQSAKPEPEPEPKSKPAAKNAVASASARQVAASTLPSGFAVQLGSFAEQANAQRYAGELSSDGYDVFVVRAAATAGALFRVYAGPENSRPRADALSAKLRAKGHSVMVVDLGAGRG